MSYATETSVSVERSRAEIESTLARYGAVKFAYATEEKRAAIMFVINGLGVRFELPLPDKSEKQFWFTPQRQNRRSDVEAYREWEQACRSRWRSLLLCIKAKLEACEQRITTFEAEFLAHIITPDGKTFGDIVVPQLMDMKQNGVQPRLQLEWRKE